MTKDSKKGKSRKSKKRKKENKKGITIKECSTQNSSVICHLDNVLETVKEIRLERKLSEFQDAHLIFFLFVVKLLLLHDSIINVE